MKTLSLYAGALVTVIGAVAALAAYNWYEKTITGTSAVAQATLGIGSGIQEIPVLSTPYDYGLSVSAKNNAINNLVSTGNSQSINLANRYQNANTVVVSNNVLPSTTTLSQTQPTYIIDTNTQSVGSYNPLPQSLVASNGNIPLGNPNNPFNYNLGWQGEGYYYNVKNSKQSTASSPSKVIWYFYTQKGYDQGLSGANS